MNKRFSLYIMIYFVCISFSCVTVDKNLQKQLETIPPGSDITAIYSRLGIEPYESSIPKTYFEGVQWLNRAVELIHAAEDYILISTFLVNNCPENQAIYDALAEKSAEGVRIYFLYDSSSYVQPYPDKEGFTPAGEVFMRKAGISVTDYSPLIGFRLGALPAMFDRDHRKFWIIDGETLVLGGMNLNYTSFSIPPGRGHIDSMTEVKTSSGIKEMIRTFVETWNAYSVNPLQVEDFTVKSGSNDSRIWLFNQGLQNTNTIEKMLEGLFYSAEKEVWMIQSFAFLSKETLKSIAALESRGVDVHIVYAGNYEFIQYEAAAKYTIKDLMDLGGDAWIMELPDAQFPHLKLFLIDDTVVSLGSANFNIRSLKLSREASFVSEDPVYVHQTLHWFQNIQKTFRKVTYEEAVSYHNLSYFLYYLSMIYGG